MCVFICISTLSPSLGILVPGTSFTIRYCSPPVVLLQPAAVGGIDSVALVLVLVLPSFTLISPSLSFLMVLSPSLILTSPSLSCFIFTSVCAKERLTLQSITAVANKSPLFILSVFLFIVIVPVVAPGDLVSLGRLY